MSLGTVARVQRTTGAGFGRASLSGLPGRGLTEITDTGGHPCQPRHIAIGSGREKQGSATGSAGREEVTMTDGKTGLQLRSLLKKSGELEISLVSIPTPEP